VTCFIQLHPPPKAPTAPNSPLKYK
jgi:hypothetical protein